MVLSTTSLRARRLKNFCCNYERPWKRHLSLPPALPDPEAQLMSFCFGHTAKSSERQQRVQHGGRKFDDILSDPQYMARDNIFGHLGPLPVGCGQQTADISQLSKKCTLRVSSISYSQPRQSPRKRHLQSSSKSK